MPLRPVDPYQIFMIDGIGAILSASILLIISLLSDYIGLSSFTLQCLSLFAFLLATYSWTMFWIRPQRWVPRLRIVSIFNFIYCAITLMLVMLHWSTITKLGIAYFIIEKLIVIPLAILEWKWSSYT
jgi:hypothetical protein